ncbi:MAG: DNA recombination/repair protein RecA, partial [[Clostridium] cellulosi]
KLARVLAQSKCVAIFINQLREKVGVVYGNPEVTTGGRALKFYASVRIDVRRQEAIKVGSEVIGSHTRARVVKNKVAPPFKEAEFDILYGTGISKEGEILDLAVKLDIVQKSGSWFSYGENRLGQGRENVIQLLRNDEKLRNELEAKVRSNADKLNSAFKNIKFKAATEPAPLKVESTSKSATSKSIDIEADDI